MGINERFTRSDERMAVKKKSIERFCPSDHAIALGDRSLISFFDIGVYGTAIILRSMIVPTCGLMSVDG